jgi:sugar phosphate isomerase/epimerase
MTGRRDKTAPRKQSEGRASVSSERNAVGLSDASGAAPFAAAMFGANTYSYMRSLSAEACLSRLADQGFDEFDVMVHPGHLWADDLSAAQRRALRRFIEARGLTLVSLNMPNIDINVAGAASGMRAYSLDLVTETVRLAGDLGARGVVIGPGKANPLFPAPAEELLGYFFAALDQLCPVAQSGGTSLWVENMPFAFLPGIAELLGALKRYGNDAVRIIYDIANAYFIGEDFAEGLKQCRASLELVHLSDTGSQAFRHDPVGLGTVPFADVPRALEAVGYNAKAKPKPMLEIISRDPDTDIIASAAKLAVLGFKRPH